MAGWEAQAQATAEAEAVTEAAARSREQHARISTVVQRNAACKQRTGGGEGSALSAASCAHVPANEGAGKPVAKHGCCVRLPPALAPSQAHRLAPLASDATRRRAEADDSGRRPQPALDACVVSTAKASASAALRAGPRLHTPGGIAASQATLQTPRREARASWRSGGARLAAAFQSDSDADAGGMRKHARVKAVSPAAAPPAGPRRVRGRRSAALKTAPLGL